MICVNIWYSLEACIENKKITTFLKIEMDKNVSYTTGKWKNEKFSFTDYLVKLIQFKITFCKKSISRKFFRETHTAIQRASLLLWRLRKLLNIFREVNVLVTTCTALQAVFKN